MDHQRLPKNELASLARLVDEVEISRTALAHFGGHASPGDLAHRPEVLVGAVLLVILAGGALIWGFSRRRRRPVRWDWRHTLTHMPEVAQSLRGKPAPPKPSNGLTRLILGAVVELLKPGVTRILTRKAAGAIGSSLTSALLKKLFG